MEIHLRAQEARALDDNLHVLQRSLDTNLSVVERLGHEPLRYPARERQLVLEFL